MNDYDLISVIVPVYNVEDMLQRCVDSIKKQTYRNIEIILVDDGSKDNSGKMCDIYAQNDKRIKVIHKLNGGLSEARNAGIEAATGNYIAFVDADDWIKEEMLQILYSEICRYNADVAVCDFDYYIENKRKRNKRIRKSEYIFDTKSALREMISAQKFASHACNKLYRLELFSDIRFPKGKYYEDLFTLYKVIDNAEKIIYITIPLYNYYIRKNSISNSEFNKHHMDYIEASQIIIDFVEEKYPENLRWAYINYHRNIMQTIDKVIRASEENLSIEKDLIMLLEKSVIHYNIFDIHEFKLACKEFMIKKMYKWYTVISKKRI